MGRPEKQQSPLPPGVVGSVDELAAAIGVHRRTIQEWKVKPDFPSWSNGWYEIVKVDRWRNGYAFLEDDNASSLVSDMDSRAQALIESLKAIQPELVRALPEGIQDTFADLLEETIGDVIKDAYSGDLAYFYSEFYKGEPAQ